MTSDELVRVRLDKWLWAARFFKTRALAAAAIETGKVEVNGERAKRAKLLQIGDSLRIRLGPYYHIVTVRAVSEHRGPASIAARLYEETEESRKAREAMQLQVKAAQAMSGYDRGRPTKKDRRDIERLKRRDAF
ncbi:MAG: RNA-binding protein [Gemmatimonadetes bacterium]|nr:MAG: RNA-binding protein [Gemmatimonadota bacterium]PYP54180.1 MAG: RNA-binding protein [Gemmatimonadota bacterium]